MHVEMMLSWMNNKRINTHEIAAATVKCQDPKLDN